MTSGLCTAAVTLTEADRQYLSDLPGAVDDALEADRCAHRAGHDGPHACLVQVQEGADEGVYWWVVWGDPEKPAEQPGGQRYEFRAIPPCWEPTPEGVDFRSCLLPDGHLGDHRR